MSGQRIQLITAKEINLLVRSTDQLEHRLGLGLLPALSWNSEPQLPADSEGFNSPNHVSMLRPTASLSVLMLSR